MAELSPSGCQRAVPRYDLQRSAVAKTQPPYENRMSDRIWTIRWKYVRHSVINPCMASVQGLDLAWIQLITNPQMQAESVGPKPVNVASISALYHLLTVRLP